MKAIVKSQFYNYSAHRMYQIGETYEASDKDVQLMEKRGLVQRVENDAKMSYDAVRNENEQEDAQTVKTRKNARKQQKN